MMLCHKNNSTLGVFAAVFVVISAATASNDLVTDPAIASKLHPNQMFAGYIPVALTNNSTPRGNNPVVANVYYNYIQHPDETKPLVVWMNGGPGASSLIGMFNEVGPILLNSQSRPASTPAGSRDDTWTLLKNPHAWSTVASLLVWEQPAGT